MDRGMDPLLRKFRKALLAKTDLELFKLADDFLAAGQLEMGELCYRAMVTNNSKNYYGWIGLAYTFERQSLIDDALKYLEKAIDMKPLTAEAWCRRSTILSQMNLPELAVQSAEKALELKPDCPYSLRNKGFALEMQNKNQEALQCYDRANQNSNVCWGYKGQLLVALFESEEASICFDKALLQNPYDDVAWNGKGLMYLGIEQFDKAVECYEKVLELVPRHPLLICNKASALIMQNKLAEAKKCLRKLGEIDPGHYQAMAWLGFTALWERRFEDATVWFGRALQQQDRKSQEYALGTLGKRLVAYVTGESTEYPELYQAEVMSHPLFSQCHYFIIAARTLFHLGFYREAKTALKNVTLVSEKFQGGKHLFHKSLQVKRASVV